MKIYSWNVNGIRAVLKKGAFERFIHAHNPDVLCLQETKATEAQVDHELSPYYTYFNSAEKKGYSGTAIFTKAEALAVHYGLPEHIKADHSLTDQYGDTTKEGRVTTIELPYCYVISVYTPNAKNDLSRISVREEWDNAFCAYVTELTKEKPVIFAGDLNVAHTKNDLARPKENEGKKGFTKEERDGFGNLTAAGFIDTFREYTTGNGHYTWWSHFGGARERNVGWRIDYILIDTALQPLLKSARIHPEVYGSDHCPVSIDITLDQ